MSTLFRTITAFIIHTANKPEWFLQATWLRAILSFIHIQLHARKSVQLLEDCTRAMGQMNHPHRDSKDSEVMLMDVKVRSNLLTRSGQVIPPFKWRD